MAAGSMFYVYLLASKPHGTLYIGNTSELARRVWEHKKELVPGFTKRYGVDRLLWFEVHPSAAAALRREKQLKEWKRDWKINLIERDNPHGSTCIRACRPDRTTLSKSEARCGCAMGTGLRRCRQ